MGRAGGRDSHKLTAAQDACLPEVLPTWVVGWNRFGQDSRIEQVPARREIIGGNSDDIRVRVESAPSTADLLHCVFEFGRAQRARP